ncbi:MAG: tetratricopeptide repeat protein [Elusimicrobiota bacterium]|nr:tetratricopeptide repeat protein [Elusimicrobiota bacterium]
METVSILVLLFAAAPAAARVPDPSECVDTFNLERSIACYTAIIKSFAGETPSDHKALMYRYRALLYVNGEMLGKALSDYTKSIALDEGSSNSPNANDRLVCERAGVYRKLGDYKKALADYRACVAAGNDWADEGTGESLMRLGDLKGAIRHFTRAIDRGQRYGYIYKKRAEAYRRTGETGKAAADAEKAVEMDPEDLAALYLRVKTRLNSGKARGALDDLARLEKLAGPNNEYASYRGLANYLLGNRAAAENFFKEALAAHTDSKEAGLNTACYWWGIKRDAAKARETLEKYGSPKAALPGMDALAECLKGLP